MQLQKLKDYRKILFEKEVLSEQLDKMKEASKAVDVVKGSQTNFPYIQTNIIIEGTNPKMKKEVEKCYLKLFESFTECVKYRLELEDEIQKIADAEIRAICRLKYLENKSWLEISMKMGSYDESYARKKIARYFK